jgi:hypothetical protein
MIAAAHNALFLICEPLCRFSLIFRDSLTVWVAESQVFMGHLHLTHSLSIDLLARDFSLNLADNAFCEVLRGAARVSFISALAKNPGDDFVARPRSSMCGCAFMLS